MKELYWVTQPHATFGIVVKNGRIVEAAPIGRRYIGQDFLEVAEGILSRRGSDIVFVSEEEEKMSS
ncbi:MAG TPA: hypothetical protein P5136_00675 [Methanofastidiosum sp.]|nr:hypothetical protein [Methanofastidiosum sp.]